MLGNRYGEFDGSGKVFRITDANTPMPWVNVICNGRFGVTISQNGGGFSFYDDAQHNVLTRWDMDLVRDCSGKFLYAYDAEEGTLWSLAPAPCRAEYSHYECSHTMGSTEFITEHAGIRSSWTITVAPEDAVELWLVKLTNRSDRPRRIRISSYLEWCCGVAPDIKREFHKLFFTTKHDASRNAAVATKNMWDIPNKSEKDHWNRAWPYVAAHAFAGVTLENTHAIGDKAAFLGRYGSTESPAAMTRPADKGTVTGFGRFADPVAALGGEITIPARGTVSLHYILAIAPTEAETLNLIDKYREPAAAADALKAAGGMWNKLLGHTSVSTEREDFDLLNNHWLPYQAISGRMWGRTGYYQQSGARGFRDQLQDSQVWLPIEPRRTADQIMLHATRQFADGSVNHWWHALADFGNHTACSDDYLWLPFLVSQYIKETGDVGILSRTAPFMDDPKVSTILDHCQRAIARSFDRTSDRGLPLIGSCDWNDGLSALGLEGKGESVWLGLFLCQILADWEIILSRAGQQDLSATYAKHRVAYANAINTQAWDGAWYRCATKDSGEWLGADASREGKIHLNPQTWAILTGVAPADRAALAWNAVKDKLVTPYGPLLLSPAYTIPDPDIGYITRYSPGSRENGGVYMHAATWALAAACKMKDVAAAGKIWNSISPALRGKDADGYAAEPYVTPGNVDGPLSETPGRAGWTWYTGSAAWLNRVSLEWILGIRPVWTAESEGLSIDPCPPADLGKVSVRRVWRGKAIRVSFDAKDFANGGPAKLVVDGKPIVGCVLPAAMVSQAGAEVQVEVKWGALAPSFTETKMTQPGRVG
ncbi:MAG: glycosyl transferase family 36 [Tepidisphaera sp.]